MPITIEVELGDEKLTTSVKKIAANVQSEFGAAAPGAEFARRAKDTFGKVADEAKKAAAAAQKEFAKIPTRVGPLGTITIVGDIEKQAEAAARKVALLAKQEEVLQRARERGRALQLAAEEEKLRIEREKATKAAIIEAQAVAGLQVAQRNYTGALKTLTDARTRATTGSLTAIRLETQIEQVQTRAARAAAAAARATQAQTRLNTVARNELQSFISTAAGGVPVVGRLAGAFDALGGKTALLGGAAIAVGGGLVYAAKSAADYSREVQRAARITTLSTDEVQGLSRGFAAVGQKTNDAIDAVNQFVKQLADARGGSKEAQRDFKQLGIDITDSSLTASKALDQVLERLNRAPGSIAKTGVASKLFGEEGARGVLALRNTEGGLDSLIAKHREYGGVLSESSIKRSSDFSDKLREMQGRFEGIKLSIGSAAIPAIESFLAFVAEASARVGAFVTAQPLDLSRGVAPPITGTAAAPLPINAPPPRPTGGGRRTSQAASLRDDIRDLQARRFELQEQAKAVRDLDAVQRLTALGQLTFSGSLTRAAEIEGREVDRLGARREGLLTQLGKLTKGTVPYLEKEKELILLLIDLDAAQESFNQKLGVTAIALDKIDFDKVNARVRASIGRVAGEAPAPTFEGQIGATTRDALSQGFFVDREGQATTAAVEAARARREALKRLNDEQLDFFDSIADSQERLRQLSVDDPLRNRAVELETYVRVLERANDRQAEFFETVVESQLRLNTLFDVNPLEIQARTLDGLARRVKSASELIADAQIGAIDTVFDFVDRGFDRITAGAGAFGRVISQVLSDIARLLLSRSLQQIFGLGGGGTGGGGFFGGGGGSGGIFGGGGGGGIGGILGGLLGGGRAGGISLGSFGGFGGGTFGGSILGGSSIGVAPSISGGSLGSFGAIGSTIGGFPIFGGTLGGAAGGGGLFGGVGGLAGILGPLLIGGALGSSFGGRSTAGRILGAGGGAAVGLGLAFGASVFGAGGGLASAALAALGPIGLIGAPLLIGAILLGKAKQRREDEALADSYWTEEARQIQELTRAVNSDRIDGAEALGQAAQLRANTVAQLNTIKTGSVRQSRLTNQLADVDRVYVSQLREAVERQNIRRRIGPQLIPEFDSGGRVPGFDRGFDSVVALVRPGEVILNRQQQARLEMLAGAGVFQQVGVPGFATGGRVPQQTIVGTGGAVPVINIQSVTLMISKEEAARIVLEGISTNSPGETAVRKVVQKTIGRF